MARSCGLCGGSGHNRRTCTRFSGGTVNVAPSKPVSDTMRTRRAAKCGFCHKRRWTIDRTHTSRVCPHRREALTLWISENKEWAKTFKARMINCGFGIGTMIEKYDKPMIIKNIDWEDLSKGGVYGGYRAIPIDQLDNEYSFGRAAYPPDEEGTDTVVLSRIPGEMVEKQFPPDWESGMYGIPDYLRESGGPSKKRKPTR